MQSLLAMTGITATSWLRAAMKCRSTTCRQGSCSARFKPLLLNGDADLQMAALPAKVKQNKHDGLCIGLVHADDLQEPWMCAVLSLQARLAVLRMVALLNFMEDAQSKRLAAELCAPEDVKLTYTCLKQST